MSTAQAARLFEVILSSIKRYARTVRQGDSLTTKWGTGRPCKVDKNAQALLKEDVKERPAATISQRRRFLEHITGTDPQRLHRQVADEAAAPFSKKRTVGALERDE
jgi:transposase